LTLINLILLILAGASVLAAIISGLAGLGLRSRVASSAYGVGRQEMRRTMQVSFIRALGFALLALVFFAVYGLSARPEEMLSTEPEAELTPEPPAASATPELAVTNTVRAVTSTPTTAAISPTANVPAVTTTPTHTPTPTITPTPEPSAVVIAPAGLYLRDVPGGTAELELVGEGTSLVLLPGRETVDDLEWQQVRTPGGLEGWVAADFLDYQQ
jgi:hypothetical protein